MTTFDLNLDRQKAEVALLRLQRLDAARLGGDQELFVAEVAAVTADMWNDAGSDADIADGVAAFLFVSTWALVGVLQGAVLEKHGDDADQADPEALRAAVNAILDDVERAILEQFDRGPDAST